jgi:hypothetical protein
MVFRSQQSPQDQHKVVKCKFKDQEDTRATPAKDTAADAAADSRPLPPPPSSTGVWQQQQAGWSVHLPPALGARSETARGREEVVVERLPRPKADAN